MSRCSRFLALITALALLFTVTIAVPGASAGTSGQTAVPVVFVHGFFADQCPTPGLNVAYAMRGPTQELAASGWTGDRDVVSYYACDQGGSRIGSDTTSTPIEQIASELAWYVYRTYTSKGEPVDLIAHSMGGLIVRAAIEFTAAQVSGFPPSLLVARVVAFSSPFMGVPSATIGAVPGLRGTYQAGEVLAGSTFLQALGAPESRSVAGGTRWLVIGSSGGCDVVPGASALAVPGAIKILYTGCWSHTRYLYDWTTTRIYPAYRNGIGTYAYGPLELMRIFLTMP